MRTRYKLFFVLLLVTSLFLVGCIDETKIDAELIPDTNVSEDSVDVEEIEPVIEEEPETVEVEVPVELPNPSDEIMTHTILFDDSGFSENEVTIAVGDTVLWRNERSRKAPAMLLGTKTFTGLKSNMLSYGESYDLTFGEAGQFIFVDAIFKEYSFKVIVLE